MNAKTVEEQANDGPEVNLTLGIERRDFDKIERAVTAGARYVNPESSHMERAGDGGEHQTTDPLAMATTEGFNAGELARLQVLLRKVKFN